MNVELAKKQLKDLKTAILADGKIDMTEVNVLLQFVESYIANDKFLQFKQLLLNCKEDGKITETESKLIVDEINFLIKFLTIDSYVEKAILIAAGIAVIGYVLFKLLFG